MRSLDRDLIMGAKAADVAQVVMSIIDRLQHFRPESQVVGGAAFFLLSCEHHGVDPVDTLTAITRLLNTKEGYRDEFAAVRHYLESNL